MEHMILALGLAWLASVGQTRKSGREDHMPDHLEGYDSSLIYTVDIWFLSFVFNLLHSPYIFEVVKLFAVVCERKDCSRCHSGSFQKNKGLLLSSFILLSNSFFVFSVLLQCFFSIFLLPRKHEICTIFSLADNSTKCNGNFDV